CQITIESRVPTDVREKLTQMGHQLDVRGAFSTAMGRGQAVLTDTSGAAHYGASDPRADGAAEPEWPAIRLGARCAGSPYSKKQTVLRCAQNDNFAGCVRSYAIANARIVSLRTVRLSIRSVRTSYPRPGISGM